MFYKKVVSLSSNISWCGRLFIDIASSIIEIFDF